MHPSHAGETEQHKPSIKGQTTSGCPQRLKGTALVPDNSLSNSLKALQAVTSGHSMCFPDSSQMLLCAPSTERLPA